MTNPLSRSITAQLATSLIGMVALSVLITGGVLSYISFQSQLRQLHLTQQARASVISEQINAYIDDLQRKLTYISRVRGLTTFDPDTQHNLLEGLANHNSAYEVIGLTDRYGRLQQAFPSSNQMPLLDWSNTPAFRRTFYGHEDFIGPVELDAQQQWPVLLLAVPVRDQNNKVDGMLFARINLKFLWAVLNESVVGESSYAYVVNRRYMVIAQSGNQPRQFIDLAQHPISALIASNTTEKFQVYPGLRQSDVLGNIAYIPTTNWHVVVELPLSVAYAPVYNLLGIMATSILIAILIAAGLTILLTRQIIQPLRLLINAATHFSQDELETRVELDQENEFKILANAFNHMAGQLQTTILDLRQRMVDLNLAEEALSLKNQELERYLYIASHDLRSPLINIQGFSQRLQTQTDGVANTLKDLSLPEDIQPQISDLIGNRIPRTLGFIFTNVTRMDTMISGLLQLFRTGQMKMTIKPVHMHALINRITHALNFQIEAADARIDIAELPDCYGDEDLLNRLFSNLIDNALKYRAPDRPLVVTITGEQQDSTVVYRIQDTGIGIAPAHREKIWDIFYRVDPYATQTGDGMGLSIVNTIVNKHRGQIRVESIENHGSVFYITLLNHEFGE